MNPTTTTQTTTYQPQRRSTFTPTPYTLGFNAGREGYEYANPYWNDCGRWVAYDTGHQDGRKAAAAIESARGGPA